MFILYNQNSELDVALPFLPSPRRPEKGCGVAFLLPTPFPTSRPTGSLPTGRKGRIQDGTLVSRPQGPLNGRWVKVTLELVGTLGVPQRSPKLGAYPQFPGLCHCRTWNLEVPTSFWLPPYHPDHIGWDLRCSHSGFLGHFSWSTTKATLPLLCPGWRAVPSLSLPGPRLLQLSQAGMNLDLVHRGPQLQRSHIKLSSNH